MISEEDVERLRKEAKKLNESSDKLNEVIKELEEKLKKFNLGIEARFNIDIHLVLGYGKVNGTWGIFINNQLFKDSPRHLRLEVIEFLPGLIEELTIQTRIMVNNVKEKLELANKFLNEIKND